MAPVSHGSVCDVDVAFSIGVSYTIFKVDGRVDGNLESQVKLVGVKPVFMSTPSTVRASESKYFSRSRRC